jgi:phosphatidylglycerol:prolipoprotein diacylglycerol transferase
MTKKSRDNRVARRIPPYWIPIAVLVIAGAILYGYHLSTGRTPDRVALHIGLLNFDVYWYGIIIIGGVILGAYVTGWLAHERAERLFEATVPDRIRRRPLAELGLPAETVARLRKRRIETVGGLLFAWGLEPARLELGRAQTRQVSESLEKAAGIEAAWLADAPWRVFNPDHVWSGLVWCLILAVIGARIYHILTPSPDMARSGINSAADYFRQPLQMINLRNGGLGIYGGIAGGALGLLIYSRRHRIPALAWADLAVVGVALGQAVGRWANFFNQELYGRPTKVSWAVTIDNPLPGYEGVTRFHPAFLYESLWSFGAFLVLLYLARRHHDRLRTGDLTAIYLILYGLGRIILETVRLDSRTLDVPGLNLAVPVASAVSAAVIIAMVALLAYRHRKTAS